MSTWFCMLWLFLVLVILLEAASGGNTLPGCQEDCGNGVRIPYPFGTGAPNCSMNDRFALTCEGNRPYMSGRWRAIELRKTVRFNYKYEITNISIEDNTLTVLKEVPRICPDVSNNADPDSSAAGPAIVYGFPKNFALSAMKNRLTAIGCSALAATVGANRSYTFGCLSTCATATVAPPDGSCSGYGCCQTTIPAWQRYFKTTFFRIDSKTIPWLDDARDGSRSCGYSFLVESTNYTFNESHLLWRENRTFPVVLDWFMISGSCEQVQADPTIYMCKSSNSVCNDIRGTGDAFVGYNCRCSSGYRGNPYVVDGCEDIDECKDPSSYPCNGTCVNIPGSYICNSKANQNKGSSEKNKQ